MERHELLLRIEWLDTASIEMTDFLEVGACLLLFILISIVNNSIVN